MHKLFVGWESALVFHCCHRFRDLKPQKLLSYSSVSWKSDTCLIRLKSEIYVQPRLHSFMVALKGESISLFIQIVGRIQIHVIVGLRSSFPFWLSDEGHSQHLEAAHIPWLMGPPFIFRTVTNSR